MKGAIAILRITSLILLWLIYLWFAALIDLANDLTYCVIDLSVGHYFLGGIHKEHIQTTLYGQVVLLFSIAFADPPLEKITFYGSFEEFLGDRYHNPVPVESCPFEAEEAHSRHIAVLTLGKKHRYAVLAAQSFFFRKSIDGVFFHDQFLER